MSAYSSFHPKQKKQRIFLRVRADLLGMVPLNSAPRDNRLPRAMGFCERYWAVKKWSSFPSEKESCWGCIVVVHCCGLTCIPRALGSNLWILSCPSEVYFLEYEPANPWAIFPCNLFNTAPTMALQVWSSWWYSLACGWSTFWHPVKCGKWDMSHFGVSERNKPSSGWCIYIYI